MSMRPGTAVRTLITSALNLQCRAENLGWMKWANSTYRCSLLSIHCRSAIRLLTHKVHSLFAGVRFASLGRRLQLLRPDRFSTGNIWTPCAALQHSAHLMNFVLLRFGRYMDARFEP